MSKLKFISLLLVMVLLACGAAVAWRSGLLGKKYTATAHLLVDRPEPDVISNGHSIPLDDQMGLVKSRFVLSAALRDPRVKNRPSIKREEAHHNTLDWLKKEIHVKCPYRRMGVFTVSLTSSDPNEAAALVNAVVDAYMNECINVDCRCRKDRLSEVQRLATKKENEVRTKREQLKREGEQERKEAGSLGRSPVAAQMAPTDLEETERELLDLTKECEWLRIDLEAGPEVRVLGDPNCPAAVPEHPD